MRLATLDNDTADGQLVVVSSDGRRYLAADKLNLLTAMADWQSAEPVLQALHTRIAAGEGKTLRGSSLYAPLPRTWQWLDGSAFATHGRLMQIAFNLPPVETNKPLMYQGMSHCFLAASEDVPFPSEADGIDFEGEFGIITGDVPMGCTADQALSHIRLVILINDWSLRAIAPVEMKTGFGWIQAKPACSVAPFAVSPDELGDAWSNGRVQLPLTVRINGEWFGSPHGGGMSVGFHELIAHAARTRSLPAGTIIGSGTVSSADHANVGSTCLSERRPIEIIADGGPKTPYLSFGDRVEMWAGAEGYSPFGIIDQYITRG